jgi:hypothetical protein
MIGGFDDTVGLDGVHLELLGVAHNNWLGQLHGITKAEQ